VNRLCSTFGDEAIGLIAVSLVARAGPVSPWRYGTSRRGANGKGMISHPYSLDIWAPRKVLSVQWAGSDNLLIVSFRRGSWEQDLLTRAASIERQFAE
jgi:hypothetical protein